MPGFSDYLENHVVNWLRGTAMPAAPGGLYVALFTGDPTDTGGGGAEVTTTVRVAGRVVAPFAAPATPGVILNSAIVDFGAAAGAVAGGVTHVALYDAQAGGNLLASQALPAPVNVAAGNIVTFAANALSVTLT